MIGSANLKARGFGRIVLALVLPALLAACESAAPRDTKFNWNLQSDQPEVHHAKPTHYASNATTSNYRANQSTISPRQKPAPGWYQSQNRPAPPPPPPVQVASVSSSSGTFGWPLQGHILADYGTTASGERNDGINIAAAVGTPIHASAGGTVTYAGNELKGYGNLILIRHDDGYVTAYAHAENILVSRGDVVSRGQVIGYAGDTGDVTEPQLHFEIRHEMTPVNPHLLLVRAQG